MMKRVLLSAVVFFLAFGTMLAQQFESGKVRIKFKSEMTAQLDGIMTKQGKEMGRTLQARNGFVQMGIADVDGVNQLVQAQEMTRVFRPAGKFEARHREWGLHLWYEVKFNSQAELKEIMNAYGSLASVEIAERVNVYNLNDSHDATAEAVATLNSFAPMTITGGTPNDPSYSQQWGYPAINAAQAWELETGHSSVVVAIEDQGVDYNHPDLDGNMWTNPGETPGNGVDDDNNGYVDDYYGWNFGNNNSTIAIDYHGTHVGGTVAAETNNGVGVAGTAGGSGSNDGVRLMTLSVFGSGAQGGFDEAFIYAADNGAAISQNSWGGGAQSSVLENAIDYFRANGGGGVMNGGLVVFAAGNDNSSSASIGYPGSYSSCLAVASIASNWVRSSFSNYGSWVDIAAPGSSIYSTYPLSQGSYASISGTSMACPHVSGVAALVLSKRHRDGLSTTDDELWSLVVDNANPALYNTNGSYSGQLGSGMLDAYAALTGQPAPPPPPPACNDADGDVTLSLLTDNYASETSWTLKDENGTTVASGSGYSNNTSYSETFSNLDGRYTFTINDSYGDGICCSYGSGSYSLVDANGVTLVSGGSFGSSEATDICVTPAGGGGGGGGGGTIDDCGSASGVSGSRRTWKYYTWTVPANSQGTTVTTTGSDPDADLYVRWNANPTTSNYVERSITASSNESVSITGSGTLHIGVYAYSAYTGLTVEACNTVPAPAMAVITDNGQEMTFNGEVEETVEVYPNPVQDVLNVNMNVAEGSEVVIFTMTGAEMLRTPAAKLANGINVAGLPNGMYMITVVGEKGNLVSQRFIKQ